MPRSGFVAIIGEPNVGKSTLLNRWVGEHLAIVTQKPQTTRVPIRGIVNRPDAQVIFVDTPGFHDSAKALNQYMIEKTKNSIADTDVCCMLTVPPAELSPLNQELLVFAGERRKPVIVAVNKIDTIAGPAASAFRVPVVTGPLGKSSAPPAIVYPVSALTGQGCDILLEAIVALLPEGPALFPDDIYTEHPVRFLASELIREVLLEKLHQELPYAAAVMIDEFKEKPEITVIKAAIVVEKDSQKSMVIGSAGRMIKEIGTEARRRIEKLLDQKVFLELLVRVEKNWTKDPKKLEELGYGR